MLKRPRTLSSRIQKASERSVVGVGAIGLAGIIYIIYTSPEPYIDDMQEAPIACIEDYQDDFDYSNFTPHSELFEDGKLYGKDGEEIEDGEVALNAITDEEGIVLGYLPHANNDHPYMPSPAPYSKADKNYFNGVPGTFGGGGGDKRILTPEQKGSICATAEVSEPKSWHLIVIGFISFLIWRWVK